MNLVTMAIAKRMRNPKGDPTADLTYPPEYDEAKEQVSVTKNLQYPSAHQQNFYDLYLPKDGASPCPVVIWVHGGMFIAGTKDGVVNVATMLAARGCAVAAMDYALAPEAKHPIPALQVQELYTHLRQQAHGQMDMERMFIAGDSAGALIAAQFALIETDEAYAKELGTAAVLPKDALKGAILTCGPYDLPQIRKAENKLLRFGLRLLGKALFGGCPWHKSAPCKQSVIVDHVTEAYPPVYITDGNTGSFEAQGRRLTEALRTKNVAVRERFFDLEGGAVPHEYLFQLADEKAQLCLGDIMRFIEIYQ